MLLTAIFLIWFACLERRYRQKYFWNIFLSLSLFFYVKRGVCVSIKRSVYATQGRGDCAKMIVARESSRRRWGPVGPQVRLTRQEYPRTRPRQNRVGILYQRRVHWPRHGLIREIWPYIIIRLCFRRWSRTSARMRARGPFVSLALRISVYRRLPPWPPGQMLQRWCTSQRYREISLRSASLYEYLEKERNSRKKRCQNSLARIHATHLARNVTVSSRDLFV